MKKYLYVFGIAAAAVACTPKVSEVVEETTEVSSPEPTMSTDAIEGKQVYAKKCASCHDMKIIDNYTEAQWAGILPNMITKAKLDETASKQVTEYVNWELKH